jgi:uncharacterized protein (UPF0335 family)
LLLKLKGKNMLNKPMEDARFGVASGHLRAFIERIERVEEEKKALSEDIREIYAEAKSSGFDVKTIRKIVKMRSQSDDERMEAEAILATYMHALGMVQPDLFNECAA